MYLTKNDFNKKRINKNYDKNNKNLIQENQKFNIKNENKYFHKKIYKNNNTYSPKEVLNKKYSQENHNKNIDNNYNIINLNNNNSNSVKTRNKHIKNDNIIGMMTDFNFYKKNLINDKDNNNRENNRKQKNSSLKQRYQKVDDEIFLNENNENENYRNHIYLRLNGSNTLNSEVKKSFGNQFNIKDAKNILNINYFYDQIENNFQNQDEIFYTDNCQPKFIKKIKSIDRRNKYNSMKINEQRNEYNIPIKTINNFYIRKNPINFVKNINNNYKKDIELSKNAHFNFQNNIKNEEKNTKLIKDRIRNHSTFERNDNNYSLDKFYSNTDNNNKFVNNNKKIIKRNGNRIKIFKKNNNTSIQEYNLSLENEEDNLEDLESSDIDSKYNSQNNGYIKNFSKNKNYNKDLNIMRKFQQYFIKNIEPICITRFEIKNNKSKFNMQKKKLINKSNNNLDYKRSILSNKNNEDKINDNENNLEETPNFSEIRKTPKNNNIILKNQINPLSLTEHLESKFQQKIIGINDNSLLIFHANNFEIVKNKINNSKLIFNTEEEMIEYIYNKFEEERKKKNYFNRKLRFTGFVLSKKYKGKNLSDIRIEDNIDQINKKLKEENILVNGKKIELIFTDDLNNLRISKEENLKLKEEKENIFSKDNMKNELIKKLEDENLKLNQEIIKLKKEIENLKEIK